jgi:predicted nucleic acid-binding protein
VIPTVSVFVDTSAFYAVLDADDLLHPAGKSAWMSLLEQRSVLHTTSYVLVETMALLQRRIGVEGARTFVADILPVVQVAWVDEGMHRSAQHALLVAARRDLTLVDCVSFQAMRRLGLATAFSFDQHLSEQGFKLIPAPR